MSNPRTGITHPQSTPPELGDALEIAEGILWIRMPLPVAVNHVNLYALDEGDSWTLVDTGMNTRKSRAIFDTLLAGPLGGKPIGRVIVTHHHPDHMGLAGWFQAEHGAELWTTRTAWLFARMLHLDVQETPPETTQRFWREAGMDPDIFAQRMTERPLNFADLLWPMPLGFQRIQQGDVITLGQRQWDVHIGHGHAPEQATFWCRDMPLVLAGDQILPGISPNIGVYATEPRANPLREWIDSCRYFEPLAKPDHLVMGGHKLPFQGLPWRLRQLIDNHVEALDRLRDFLHEPRSAADCFSVLYKRNIGPGEYGLALVEAVAHLNYLFEAGDVTRELRDGCALFQIRSTDGS